LSIPQRPPLRGCEAISEDECRALYCPKARKRLAYCPWTKNGVRQLDELLGDRRAKLTAADIGAPACDEH
jgi:hypothetical protein